jgi:hypothetical protein
LKNYIFEYRWKTNGTESTNATIFHDKRNSNEWNINWKKYFLTVFFSSTTFMCVEETEKSAKTWRHGAGFINIRFFCLFLFVIMCSWKNVILLDMEFISSLSRAPESAEKSLHEFRMSRWDNRFFGGSLIALIRRFFRRFF